MRKRLQIAERSLLSRCVRCLIEFSVKFDYFLEKRAIASVESRTIKMLGDVDKFVSLKSNRAEKTFLDF